MTDDPGLSREQPARPDASDPAFSRVLLKLSGEALLGDLSYGADPDRIAAIAGAIADVNERGVQMAVVVGGGNIGVLVEVDCETDFVARTEEFQDFAREVALHVAAADPRYVSYEDVPEEDREAEEAGFSADEPATPSGTRPETVAGAAAPRERRTFDPDDDS